MPATPSAPTGTHQDLQFHQADPAQQQAELAAGLQATPASVSPKFFYDRLGSHLFDAITELPEYYPTRTEAAIFGQWLPDMAARLPARAVWIDLGAGSCAKAARLFGTVRPAAYLPVDISAAYLSQALEPLRREHPDLPMLGIGQDFSVQWALPAPAVHWLERLGLRGAPRCVFYPGSSIGNFGPDEALRLLRDAHAVCRQGGAGSGLLIGVDRVKAPEVLEPAYDDALGVTAAFNRNLLLHVNRQLGSDFDPAAWDHVAFYNRIESRIEMHLSARSPQTVSWPGGSRRFAAGERIHTEHSYKWEPAAFADLLQRAGFATPLHWTDARGWFSVFWAPA
ncbi:L-histidine N(alpha)-methyltransferase [Hydrogenophaga sp. IBVHS2]|uniref:L-histidine N(alpha)-methyltransferase n=1 Tax=Hydrogenophaga sp. IBVHS2 TaxID=1985170 RepID=UPI000A2DB9F4|nr:L-histidine N(alpha)-methyltransferase [Hydrogenophaga sp. IBVHS2]OSZ67401.1 L-histidine N(alpha)-methyltransferase [Hydrogenophaga sp. IBVHS2]